MLTSSTGSALLAATGLLRGRTAATHWLAGPLLERHGVVVSDERIVVDLPYVTCAGLASAYDAAFVVVARASAARRWSATSAGSSPTGASPGCRAPTAAGASAVARAAARSRPTTMVEVELEETPAAGRR